MEKNTLALAEFKSYKHPEDLVINETNQCLPIHQNKQSPYLYLHQFNHGTKRK